MSALATPHRGWKQIRRPAYPPDAELARRLLDPDAPAFRATFAMTLLGLTITDRGVQGQARRILLIEISSAYNDVAVER